MSLVPTVERVQWLVSSLENRVASFMNTAAAFRMNVTKSWMWMKFLAQRSLLSKDEASDSADVQNMSRHHEDTSSHRIVTP